eukprot:TRINITY_DN18646_c0_g1_i2.p1 TRINITY_DN18646_c0_g1~~TRINITY_DN18646_c0_g1_i2.p1  ORF type:complete len:284 (+),score=54.45 TRINITY_DN18646_c0_g1_i2:51-902(+)
MDHPAPAEDLSETMASEAPSQPEAPSGDAEQYPSTFVQDDVGRAALPSKSVAEETAHLLATGENMLAKNDVRWRGGSGAPVEEGREDPEDPEGQAFKAPASEWDDMFVGDYFTVMGFVFKMNELRLNQKHLPFAIGLLLWLYMILTLYILHVLLGGFMIHVAIKYQHDHCEQNLSQWTLVMGVYIVAAFALTIAAATIKLAWKKEPFAVLQHCCTLFAIVWFIIGCVRVYRVDSDECPAILYHVGYYYCTVILSMLGFMLGTACMAGVVVGSRRGQDPEAYEG